MKTGRLVQNFKSVQISNLTRKPFLGRFTSSCTTRNLFSTHTIYLHVCQQVMFQGKILLASPAVVRPLFGMQQQMRVQAVLVREALPAIHARMGLLARVGPRVSGQMVLHQKRLAAFFARIRPQLSRFVRGQLFFCGSLAAVLTRARGW